MKICRPLVIASAALLLVLPLQAGAFTFGETEIPIPDNTKTGAESNVPFPVILGGDVSGGVEISIVIDNSDISGLTVSLIDPNEVSYILYEETQTGMSLVETYTSESVLPMGDLSTWIGTPPTGDWTLTVVDSLDFDDAIDGIDGEIVEWSVTGLPLPEPSSRMSSLVALLSLGVYRARVRTGARSTSP